MLLYSAWLRLPINLRHKIASELNIPKKHPTHVQDNVIVTDGYSIQDVEKALTVENLQVFLGVGSQENDINVLWQMLITPPSHEANVVNDIPVITLKQMIDKQTPEVKKAIEKEVKRLKTKGRPRGSKNK